MSVGPFLETKLIRPLRVKMCKLLHMISWEVIFVVFAGNNQKPCYNNWRPLSKLPTASKSFNMDLLWTNC